jgi:hypothetical protein
VVQGLLDDMAKDLEHGLYDNELPIGWYYELSAYVACRCTSSATKKPKRCCVALSKSEVQRIQNSLFESWSTYFGFASPGESCYSPNLPVEYMENRYQNDR